MGWTILYMIMIFVLLWC